MIKKAPISRTVKVLLLTIACLAGLATGLLAAPLQPEAALEKTAKAIAVDQDAHKRGKQWEVEQNALLEELRHASLEYAWYQRQSETFRRYVETATERVEKLKRSVVEQGRMEKELEGELLRISDELATTVDDDIPFLIQERQGRLAFVAKSVTDYELPLAEKLRRVLEALQAELSYSIGTEWGPGAITLDGNRQGVTLVRAGRVGFYALALDESKGWHWTRKAGFVSLDENGLTALRSAVSMLKTGQFDSIPVLPVTENK